MTPTGPATPRNTDPPQSSDAALLRRCERLAAENSGLQSLVARLLDSLEDERRDLARALHAGAGGSITAVRMAAHAAMAEDDPARRNADLADVLVQAGEALDEIRGLCARLRPPPLDAVGLEAALRWQVDRLEPADRDRLTLGIAALPRRPSPGIEQACFRIAEEALANALRHSGADVIELLLDASAEHLRLEVNDQGRGFDAGTDSTAGTGLATMRARAWSLGGRLELASGPGQGTRVLAVLPFR